MKSFEEFVKIGEVKRQNSNPSLASALIKSSEKCLNFVKKLEINNENAEHIVQDCYDIMREIIEAKLSLEGYKSYSHEATIIFLKRFNEFTESEIDFLDRLRKVRNGIKYYGKEANANEAEKAIEFLDKMLPKLKKLINGSETPRTLWKL